MKNNAINTYLKVTDGKFNLSQKGCMEIMKLFMTKDEDLYDKTIEDVFDEEVLPLNDRSPYPLQKASLE